MESYILVLKRGVKIMMIMNNSEMINRFRVAAGYQRKAVRALFPETMEKHFDVIENEIKLMLTEAAMEMIKECGKNAFDCMVQTGTGNSEIRVDERKTEDNHTKKNKKVDID